MKKRILSTLLVLVLIVGLLPGTAWAADSDFTIENGVLIKYNGSGGDVTIPSSVTSIGEYAFQWCSNLTSISIPDGVTSIGNFAFNHCSSLISVNIPDGVTSIGKYAFGDCSSLTSVTIPSSVTSIEEYAFSNCRSLTSVSIPFGVTSIGERAFYKCTGLVSVTIPSSVTSIGIYVFEGCTSLTNVTIPFGITSIENGEFYWCSNLTSITIPPSITNIGGSAFSNCRSLTSVTIPSGITSIEAYTFNDCIGLTSMDIPSGVTSIGWWAFDGCTGLTSVNIPDSVTSIGNGAFRSCTGLKDVYYGGSEAQWKDIWINGSNECLTDATIHYNSAVPVPSTPSTPEGPSTNPTSPDGIQDTVQTNNYKVISLHDNSNTEIDFSYAVPTSGVTMLIFFRAESCSNSVYTLKSIAQSSWVDNSHLSIVLVETTGASKETVQSFVDENLGTNQIHFFDILYRPHPSNYPPTNSPYYLQFQYTKLLYGSNSVALPFVMLITEHQARNYIQFSDMGMCDAAYYGNALSTLLGTVDYTDTVNVTVAGIQYYNHASDVVKSVNTYRSQNGQTNLTWNKTLTEYAMQRAAEIALYYDHIRPNGESYNSIFDSQYGSYAWVGENIAWGQTGATEVMNSWMNSEGHRANILSANYTQIGVGCFTSRNTTYWVQLFGDSRTNTAQINSGDVKQANVTVSTLASHLNTHLTTMDTSLTISSGEAATVYFANTNSKSGKDTLLVPIVSDAKDKDNSSLTIATASVSADSQGTVTLHPQATGTGTVHFQAYEGDTNPATIMLNVEVGSGEDIYVEALISHSLIHADDETKATIRNAVFNLLFKAQYRPTTGPEVDGISASFTGSLAVNKTWPIQNFIYHSYRKNCKCAYCNRTINDQVLGTVVFAEAGAGCMAYALFATAYTYGTSGSSRTCTNCSENDIVEFIHSYADPGEQLRYNGGTHSIVFLGESANEKGFYYISYEGGKNSEGKEYHGLTVKYETYSAFAKKVTGLTLRDANSGSYYEGTAKSIDAVRSYNKVSKQIVRIACPVEATIQLGSEILDSRNPGAVSFGSVQRIGEEVQFDLIYNRDYDLTIEGTDTGEMTLTLEYYEDEVLVDVRKIVNVPIDSNTEIQASGFDPQSSFVLYTNADSAGAETWGVGINETVSGPDGSYSSRFNNPAEISETPIISSTPFTDIQTDSYYYDAVLWAVKQSITVGTSATTFSPNQNCTEIQILTFLWRAAGKPVVNVALPVPVTGVDDYISAAKWAYSKGMIDATFHQNRPCTRASAVKFIWQAFGSPAASGSSFTDVSANANYAQAVAWAVANGITTGTSATTFTPDATCTRAQIVTFLHRAYALNGHPSNSSPSITVGEKEQAASTVKSEYEEGGYLYKKTQYYNSDGSLNYYQLIQSTSDHRFLYKLSIYTNAGLKSQQIYSYSGGALSRCDCYDGKGNLSSYYTYSGNNYTEYDANGIELSSGSMQQSFWHWDY